MAPHSSRWLFLLVSAQVAVAALDDGAGDEETCNAAGVARAAFRDRSAVAWLRGENARRAPYYIAQAKKMYEKGVRQQKGIDKSNSDPFIALYDAQHQVLGALDLAPQNASIWLAAGQVTVMIGSLSEESELTEQALRMLAKACGLDRGSLQAIAKWSKEKVKGEEPAFTRAKKQAGQQVEKWRTTGIPTPSIEDFLPTIAARQDSEVCALGAAMEPLADGAAGGGGSGKEQIKAAVASMSVRPIFPTLITSVNVGAHFGAKFSERLADMAVRKYRDFSKQRKAAGQKDPNDINDAFFSAQATSERSMNSPSALDFWPELYKSTEYKLLWKFMKQALVEHAAKTGYRLQPKEKRDTIMWAAIYLSDGGRHGYHVHQSSLTSCVFYAKAPPGKTPLMFIDPRGAPPNHDYEQHLGERDFEPMAPFHHNYHFFAEAGDLVCFPSWLVHRVPSHYEAEERVAFAANLQAPTWDAWYRSATLG